MRGLLILAVSGLGLGAFWRRRKRRSAEEELPYDTGDGGSDELGPDPAEELRAKLAENRATDGGAAEEPATGEPSVERAPEGPTPETRRRELHERARASIDELA